MKNISYIMIFFLVLLEIVYSQTAPPSDFLAVDKIPENINSVRGAVFRVCGCFVRKDNCITVTKVKYNNLNYFITNLHAYLFLEKYINDLKKYLVSREYYDMKKEFNESPEKCNNSYVWDNQGTPTPIQVNAIKRGVFEPNNTKNETEQKDLVILNVIGSDIEKALSINLTEDIINPNDVIYHIGFHNLPFHDPLGLPRYENLVSEGKVVNINDPKGGEGSFLGVNGTSGGPVLNTDAELVGLFWGKKKDGGK